MEELHSQVRETLADKASARYLAYLPEIERVKNGIWHNRNGEIPITGICKDDDRLALRFAREQQTTQNAKERINGVPNFQDVYIFKKIIKLSDAVCRIIINNNYGSSSFGSGFLVSNNLLLTNNHVLPNEQYAARSIAQFEYELSESEASRNGINFKLRPDLFFLTSPYDRDPRLAESGLDFTLVAIEEIGTQGSALAKYGYAQLDAGLGKVLEGENCIVIQHPKGDYKKMVLKDIRMIALADDFLIYESDTLPGSSGSMVVGLGTSEIIALHHSAVPRKDAKGKWLRKDGSPASSADPDHVIDWIGNEGVRISRIIEAVQRIEVPVAMKHMKENFLKTIKNLAGNEKVHIPDSAVTLSSETDFYQQLSETSPLTPPMQLNQNEQTANFEVELVSTPLLQDDWETNAHTLVPGFISMELVFPNLWDRSLPKIYYVHTKVGSNPWDLAEKIEELPHVIYCAPDDPIPTDGIIGPDTQNEQVASSPYESVIYNRGYARQNEKEFVAAWSHTHWPSKILEPKVSQQEIRWWNWYAVNIFELKTNSRTAFYKDPNVNWPLIKENIKAISLVQLDTGYSNLSKIKGGIDFLKDYDFVDNDPTAEDETKKFFFKYPYHGTRTASLVIGGRLAQDEFRLEGNAGILTETSNNQTTPLLKVIPYRVANTVILLKARKNVVNAVQHAVRTGADVMFMCMGSLPSPMLDFAARQAYNQGIIWVCAAGNEVEAIVAPASYPGTIAVAASNPDDQPWKGTSYGEMIDITAPGERVYVPFLDKHKNEIMVYGDGTSYAVPHVAAAAVLWKARFKKEIRENYRKPWQIVEAFRYCLKISARDKTKHGHWNTKHYGDGILDIRKLLSIPASQLPRAEQLKNAYEKQAWPVSINSSTTQALRTIWQAAIRKINPWEPSAAETFTGLTSRGQIALEALHRAARKDNSQALENLSHDTATQYEILKSYMQQYKRNTP
jgi:endonuclease G